MFGFEEQQIQGRVALVIGGTKGIGKEIARGLANRGINTLLAARGVDVGKEATLELSEDGAEVTFHRVDMADEGSIRALAAFTREQFGRLDILVNDAALGIMPTSALEVTAADMRKVFDVNVFGVVTAVQAFFDLLASRPAPWTLRVELTVGRPTLAR